MERQIKRNDLMLWDELYFNYLGKEEIAADCDMNPACRAYV